MEMSVSDYIAANMSTFNHNLYIQAGTISDIWENNKAIVHFSINGETFRARLFTKNFLHNDARLTIYTSFNGILRKGDAVSMNCYPLKNAETSDDFCQFSATLGWKANEDDKLMVVKQQGTVSELNEKRGVLTFNFYGQEQKVYFVWTRYFNFEQKCNQDLWNFLDIESKVMFDAFECDPSQDVMGCCWMAKLVYKGPRPSKFPVPSMNVTNLKPKVANPISKDAKSAPNDKGSNLAADVACFDKPYSFYEDSSSDVRDAPGHVRSVIGGDMGIALWMTRPNCWQTVFFHGSNAYIDDYCLKGKDLRESFCDNLPVKIFAVKAKENFPCKWIARKIIVSTD